MSLPSIEVSGIAKRYVIEHESRHDSLRDTLHHVARKLWRRARWGTGFETEEFWALRDIDFTVQPGEVVGIIGRNGAGKSTLLKILARITEPTKGRVTLRGCVASLLEVGTGFHPDLTGRENIFLNGAILGMSRVEIRKKFDEIVAFAEVERFLDTPVKRYSSGMYVRLAFAVAAHLEPEILIVDEVLAVGDAAFQKKCLGKLGALSADTGRTVLFVSHNLASIQSLCNRCLLLAQGRVDFIGRSDECLNRYIQSGLAAGLEKIFAGTDPALCVDEVTFNADPSAPRIEIAVTVRSDKARQLALEFQLTTATGLPVAVASAGSFEPNRLDCAAGDTHARWAVDASRLAAGCYQMTVVLMEPLVCAYARVEHPVFFDVIRAPLPPATRVLQQLWQIGHMELEARRL